MQRALISLGWGCETAFELKMHGAENVAHFFDWLVTPMEGLFSILENDFDVFHPENLVLRKEPPHSSYVQDLPTGVVFHHQFPLYAGNMQPDFLLHYPVFIKKIKYLAECFRSYMRERPVTLVRQNISEDEALKLEDIVTRLYQQADVRFLYLNQGGDVFETPLGKSYILQQEGSLGIPSEWVKVLKAESLIDEPYRHSTLDIFGSLHHDYNLDADHRFTDEQLREAIQFNPKKIEFRLELARWYVLRGMWEQAENESLLAVIENQDSVEAKCAAIQAQLRCGRMDARQAADDLSLIIEKARPQEEWLYELASYSLEAGEAEQALFHIRKGLEIAPLKWDFYLLLADILWGLGRFKELQYPLESYQRVGTLPASYEHFLAHAYEANGNLEAALAAEDRCLAQGDRFDALYLKLNVLINLERYDEALEVCERAIPVAGDLINVLEDSFLRINNLKNTNFTDGLSEAKKAPEAVRLVIWDLDDTFWRGTLTEGGATIISEHVEMLKTLSERGIINSICSKNDPDEAERELRECGAWDYIVFPRIAFAPKGQLIADIIESAQLRAASVLFIDDNPMNLNEALHYSPDLQVAGEDVIPSLLNDRRLAGKPDLEMQRLARYKLLQQKQQEQKQTSDNKSFLFQSQVKVSFHYDVMENFARIHELVNRTNQLNFTKQRWPEDEITAREALVAETSQEFGIHVGYIKVSDRYGSYGVCGFFMVMAQSKIARHFLFSCRSMNMGVEQFVWARLGKPFIHIVGDVSSSLEGDVPDWITVVDDAEQEITIEEGQNKPLICVRGACDLSNMTHYLRLKFKTIEEFQYPYQGWGIHPLARSALLENELDTEEGRELIARMPGIPENRFKTDINSLQADIYVLSFSSELFGPQYLSRSTGVMMTFTYAGLPHNFSNMSYEDFCKKIEGTPSFTAAEFDFMRNEYEFKGLLDELQFAQDVTSIFKLLQKKKVFVLKLNTAVGKQTWEIDYFQKINSIVVPIAESFGITVIDLADFVQSPDDLDNPDDIGVHFNRSVYQRLAHKIEELCLSV